MSDETTRHRLIIGVASIQEATAYLNALDAAHAETVARLEQERDAARLQASKLLDELKWRTGPAAAPDGDVTP